MLSTKQVCLPQAQRVFQLMRGAAAAVGALCAAASLLALLQLSLQLAAPAPALRLSAGAAAVAAAATAAWYKLSGVLDKFSW